MILSFLLFFDLVGEIPFSFLLCLWVVKSSLPVLCSARWFFLSYFFDLVGEIPFSFLLCLRIVKSFCRYYCSARWFVLFFFDLVGEMFFVGIFYLSIILVVVVVVLLFSLLRRVYLFPISYYFWDDFESWAIFFY